MFEEVMFSSLKRRFAAIFVAVILISSCSNNASPKADENMSENIHPNGLIVKLGKDFSAKQTVNGFLVEPAGDANKNLRVPVEIKIDFIKDKNIESATFRHEKSVGSRRIRYELEKSDGGSNGETYDFTGYEKVSGGTIEYRQTTQSKAVEPDFSALWKIIENTTLKK